jgi:hypothetical protein
VRAEHADVWFEIGGRYFVLPAGQGFALATTPAMDAIVSSLRTAPLAFGSNSSFRRHLPFDDVQLVGSQPGDGLINGELGCLLLEDLREFSAKPLDRCAILSRQRRGEPNGDDSQHQYDRGQATHERSSRLNHYPSTGG